MKNKPSYVLLTNGVMSSRIKINFGTKLSVLQILTYKTALAGFFTYVVIVKWPTIPGRRQEGAHNQAPDH